MAEDDNWLLNAKDKVIEKAIAIISDKAKPASHIKLYDSSCSIYITPYHEHLKNYLRIIPKTMNIANKQSFYAIRKRDMTIKVSNSTKTSELKLTKVLYSFEVGYTFVSIRKLDECGFQCFFDNGKCSIFTKKEDKIDEIPKNAYNLYKYTSELPTTNAIKQVTLQQLHWYIGHISPDIAKKLIIDRLITDLQLITTNSNDLFFCKTYTYTKST